MVKSQTPVVTAAIAMSLFLTLLSSRAPAQTERGAVAPAFRAWRKLAGYVPPIAVTDWPVRIDSKAQLFIDDFLVAQTNQLKWTLHQPIKHPRNPIAPAGRCSVLIDPAGKWRMYRVGSGGTHLHYSRDGIAWDDGRLVFPDRIGSVFYDPQTTNADQRWKAVVYKGVEETAGLFIYYSADGINWTPRQERLLKAVGRAPRKSTDGWPYIGVDDSSHIAFDQKLNKYVASIKTWNFHGGDRGDPEYRHTRIRAMAFSDDHIHWDRPFVILDADDFDPVGFQFYDSVHFSYESMWLGFVRTLYARSTGMMDLQLVSSRDGRIWERAGARQTFLPNGPMGEFDGGNLDHAFSPPVRAGNKLYIYYTASQLGHLGYGGWEPVPNYKQGIGLAMLRLDGFVSLDASGTEGHVLTRPLTSEGNVLHVNVDADEGHLVVEIVDESGQPLKGFAKEDCLPITTNTVDSVVRWKHHDDLSALTGKTFRIKFSLKNASLYSFTLNNDTSR